MRVPDHKRLLTGIFLSEAVLEFPDAEQAAVTRVIQSAVRAGRLPRDAAENWPITTGSRQKSPSTASGESPPQRSKPTTRSAGGGGGKDPSGRLVPSQSTLRTGDPDTMSHEPPRSLRKHMAGSTASSPTKTDSPSKTGPTPPSLLKRAFSRVRGRDPENNLPIPKSAVQKVSHGPVDPDFGQERPYVSPFAHIPGLSTDEFEDDTEGGDPRTDTIKRGLRTAGPHVARDRRPDNDNDNDDDSGSGVRGRPKQGRLSRLFKGRRDDGI